MAFDKKRLKTFEWLQKIADGKARYCKGVYNPFHDICVFCGQFYATNGIVLMQVDYPEFEHLSDYEWSSVVAFKDDDGLLLETPEIELRGKQFKNNRFFADMFIKESVPFEMDINPAVMKDALKPFEINGILPTVYTNESKIEFAGHNKDVSIRTLVMGVKR